MRVNGKNCKSLNFSVLEDKLRAKLKTQTYRTIYFPKYRVNEIIAITFKKEFLYLVRVTEIYPKQVKDLTIDEALRDGFESIIDFHAVLFDLNISTKNTTLRKKKEKDYLEQWGMITRWKPIEKPDLEEFL